MGKIIVTSSLQNQYQHIILKTKTLLIQAIRQNMILTTLEVSFAVIPRQTFQMLPLGLCKSLRVRIQPRILVLKFHLLLQKILWTMTSNLSPQKLNNLNRSHQSLQQPRNQTMITSVHRWPNSRRSLCKVTWKTRLPKRESHLKDDIFRWKLRLDVVIQINVPMKRASILHNPTSNPSQTTLSLILVQTTMKIVAAISLNDLSPKSLNSHSQIA